MATNKLVNLGDDMKDLSQLLTIINKWTEQYQNLLNILVNEQTALEKRDFTSLESLVEKKNLLVKEINSEQLAASQLNNTTQALNLSQMKQYCIQNEELHPIWEKLMVVVSDCHKKNEVNSRLIELVTNSTKRTFNLIKGFDPDNNIYDAKGDRKIVKHYGQPVSA